MRAYLWVLPACLVHLATGGLCGAAAGPAGAGSPPGISDRGGEPMGIFGGTEVDPCGWPTVVGVSGGGFECTGTLVHPRVVMFAAHCGEGTKQIHFGEDLDAPAMTLQAELCMVNPDYGGPQDQEHDWGFCRLKTAITELPVTPVVFGCEQDLVVPKDMATIAGYGYISADSDAGRKHWASTPIRQVYSQTADVGGLGDPGVCPGDSGGAAFVRYADGSWHTFGIASTVGGSCGGVGTYALAWNAVPFIEENSGIDVTPCHDPDGAWNPSFRCGDFFAGEPGVGAGDWPGWCAGSPASPSSTTCGAAFDAGPDEDPPTVAITTPTTGEHPDQNSFSTAIEIAADDGDGWGIAAVRIKINGMLQPVVDDQAPYSFSKVDFPKGTWELIAVAEDAAGHVAESAPVTLVVGSDAPPTTGDADTTPTSSSDSAGSTSDTGDSATMDAGEGGCGCASEPPAAGTLGLLGLLGLLGFRRKWPATTATSGSVRRMSGP